METTPKQSPEEKKIHYFKLANGEDIIAKLIGSDNVFIYIKHPIRVISNLNAQPGEFESYLANWLPYISDTPHALLSNNVVAISPIIDDIKQVYNEYVEEKVLPVTENNKEAIAKPNIVNDDEYHKSLLKKVFDNIKPNDDTTWN
tara:strand:- start:4418 stop:4852 length:435 start_codon:yes stop_codon:yes gene_type:complete